MHRHVKLPTKTEKTYPDFPLTAHNNGQWCKKIRGKVHFLVFGQTRTKRSRIIAFPVMIYKLDDNRDNQTNSQFVTLSISFNAIEKAPRARRNNPKNLFRLPHGWRTHR
jgi:hypothetical protein